MATASAQWPAIGSGYAVTTNWHGTDVPIGESVTAWAGTTDSAVTEMRFVWHDPATNVVWNVSGNSLGGFTTPTVPLGAPGEIATWANDNQGIKIWYWTDTKVPDIPGDWGVQAIFLGRRERPRGDVTAEIAIRSTSMNTVPEVPILGTIGAAATMLLGIGFFSVRKRRVF